MKSVVFAALGLGFAGALTWVVATRGLSGSRAIDEGRVVPIAGRVLVDGRPAVDAMIEFHPIGRTTKRVSVGRSSADGSYRITTSSPGDGVAEGEYAVTLTWADPSLPYDECGDMSQHDLLRGTYASPAVTPLRMTVWRDTIDVPLSAFTPGWWSPRQRDRDNPSDKEVNRVQP